MKVAQILPKDVRVGKESGTSTAMLRANLTAKASQSVEQVMLSRIGHTLTANVYPRTHNLLVSFLVCIYVVANTFHTIPRAILVPHADACSSQSM